MACDLEVAAFSCQVRQGTPTCAPLAIVHVQPHPYRIAGRLGDLATVRKGDSCCLQHKRPPRIQGTRQAIPLRPAVETTALGYRRRFVIAVRTVSHFATLNRKGARTRSRPKNSQAIPASRRRLPSICACPLFLERDVHDRLGRFRSRGSFELEPDTERLHLRAMDRQGWSF